MPQTQISQTSFQPPTEGLGSSPFIRFWYIGQNFIAGDGVTPVMVGDGQTGFYIDHVCSIVNDRVVMPAINLWATTDGSPGTSRFIGQLYAESGSPTSYFPFGQSGGWQLPTVYGSVIAYDQLMRYNAAAYLLSAPPSYFTADQTIAEIRRIAGDFDYANVGVLGVTELDTAPADAAHPIAVGINSLLLGQGFYFLSRYDSLADAVTDIGSDQATLLIDSIAAVSVNLTIPKNITLFFTNEGGIQPANSITVLILGPVEAPPVKIFYNATSGQGTIAFASGASYLDTPNTVQKDFWVEWWGAVGDNDYAKGTANAAALNAAFVALPHGGTMRMAGNFYPINSGVTFDHKFQCTLKGNDANTGPGDNFTKPIFVYRGANGGTALTLSNVYSCAFRGFGVYSNDGQNLSNGADKGLLLTYTASGFPSLTSHCVLEGLNILALNTRATWVGLDMNDGAGANNEHHSVIECTITGGVDNTSTDQIAVQQAHSQVKGVEYRRNNISNVGTGISCQGGFRAYNNSFLNVGTCYFGNYLIDASYVFGDDNETIKYYFRTAVGQIQAPVSFAACRVENVTAECTSETTAVFQVRGKLDVDACAFVTTSSAPFGEYFLGGPANGNYNPVMFRNCIFGSGGANSIQSLARGFSTCSTTVIDGRRIFRFGGSRFDLGDEDLWTTVPGGGATPEVFAGRRTLWVGGTQSILGAAQLNFGDTEIAVSGLFMPNKPTLTLVGTTGATTRRFTIIAVDSTGRRSLSFEDSDGRFVGTTSANATLSGSNYIRITWPAQNTAPDHFEVYEVNPADSAQWRYVDSVSPGGTSVETYDVVANPAGSFVSTRPSWNESGFVNLTTNVVFPNEVTFTDADTTPSVAKANDFVTANTGATSITNFDDPTTGKEIRIRVADANTTFVNGTIITGTGGNVAGVNGAVYKFIYRATAWRRIL